jgi:hypothetical protein
MASFKMYRIVTSVASSPMNFVSGTTSGIGTVTDPSDKGVSVTFQNQSTGAINVWIGGSTMSISIGSTSTVGAGGVVISQSSSYTISPRHAPSAIQMADYWVASTSSLSICTALLIKAV